MKCPKCKSAYMKASGDLTDHCSNPECILWYHEHKKFDWDRLLRKIRYPSFKDTYYCIRNRFFKRYDLIRTGMGKSSWCDKDYLILHGMMGLLVDYIEKEEAFEHVDLNFNKLDDLARTPLGDAILELYTDWKVNYPKLVQMREDALSAWCASSRMSLCDDDESGRKTCIFKTTEGYTEDESKKLFDDHGALETKVYKMEQAMLHRLVDVRSGMWT